MPKLFPPANGLSPKMRELIVNLAQLQADDRERPQVESHVSQHRDSLIDAWADDSSLPLFIRKVNNNRGCVVLHASGRALVPTSWAFADSRSDPVDRGHQEGVCTGSDPDCDD